MVFAASKGKSFSLLRTISMGSTAPLKHVSTRFTTPEAVSATRAYAFSVINSIFRLSQPGTASINIMGSPLTAASVVLSPPGLVKISSAASI